MKYPKTFLSYKPHKMMERILSIKKKGRVKINYIKYNPNSKKKLHTWVSSNVQNKITDEGPGNEHNLKHRKVLCGIQKKKKKKLLGL